MTAKCLAAFTAWSLILIPITTGCGGPLAHPSSASAVVAEATLEASLYVTVGDVLSRQGGMAMVQARVHTGSLLRRAVPGAVCSFERDGEDLGEATTNDKGVAMVHVMVSHWPSEANLAAVCRKDDQEAADDGGTLFVVPRDAPIFVTDIDETISDLPGSRVPFTPNDAIPPVAGAQEALGAIAGDEVVVYLTSRDLRYTGKTREWLAMHDFPPGPVFLQDWQETTDQGEYKRAAIAKLKMQFTGLTAGAGDMEHDAEAYIANGLRAYLFNRDFPGALRVAAWDEILADRGS